MKKLYALITLCLFLSQTYAQSWQWEKKGGSSDAITEKVIDMATDKHNNIYILSKGGQSGLNVATHSVNSYGGVNAVISSFDCSGNFRWAKVIGGPNNDEPRSIQVDTLGGVYIAGTMYIDMGSLGIGHIDTDSTIPQMNKSLYLAKFDTSGNYKWFRMPQPDTISVSNSFSHSGTLDLATDGAGNIYWYCLLPPGAFANGGYIVPSQGYYILKYDRLGNFISGTPIQMSGNMLPRVTRDPSNGRFYMDDYIEFGYNISFAGNPVTHSAYVAAFNSTGQFLWKKENSNQQSQIIGRVCIMNSNELYFTGNLNGLIGSNIDTICNIPFNFNIYGGPVVIKVDSNGNGIWGKIAVTNAGSSGYGITIRNNNELVMVGAYPGSVQWPGFSGWYPNHSPNQGYDVFITRFNAQTGLVLGNDTLGSAFGFDDFPSSTIVTDKSGNVYVGGQFSSNLIAGANTIQSTGGTTDFFIAKYGSANCSTTSIETPSVAVSNEIKVYPNPSTGILHVDNLKESTNYRIVNLIGSIIQQGTLQSGSSEISLKEIPSGLYAIELTCESGFRTMMKVIKE